MRQEKITQKILTSLLAKGLITQEQSKPLARILKIAEFEEQIRKDSLVDDESFARIKAEVFNLPYIDLHDLKVKPEILNIIPKEIANNYRVIAFKLQEKLLQVAVVDPTNLKAQEAVEFLARKRNLKVKYFICSRSGFAALLRQYSGLGREVQEALDVVEGELAKHKVESSARIARQAVKSAPISKMVSVILRHAVEGRASDIHIEPLEDSSRVRYRVDGILHTSLILPKYIHSAVVSRIKVLANLKIDETRVPQDGRIRLFFDQRGVDFRISTLPLHNSEKVVMRILDTSSGAFSLEELGFEGRNLAIIKENISRPNGVLLVTGPTGSGKSTTLYSVLNILNNEGVNIVTLEDPIEYFIKGINQSQVNPDVNYTFASGLRSILRQDPDVIMVGEIRDNETAELATHAGLTGHFVLSTLHTNDAFGAIPRLLDMKVESFLIASTLNLVIAQRLARRICSECRCKKPIPASLRQEVAAVIDKITATNWPDDLNKKELTFWAGRGCGHCNGTGYAGRVAIVEILEINEDIREIIATGKNWSKIRQEFDKSGMLDLREDGILKALRGLTSFEEVMRVTKE